MNNPTKEQFDDLNALYLDIEHSQIVDGEVTLNGNGTNSYEAGNVIHAVYDVLGLEVPKVTKESFDVFCEYHGIDPEEYEYYFDEN
jgi:hypothetical protein